MIHSRILDGTGSHRSAHVDPRNALRVTVGPEDVLATRKAWESGALMTDAGSSDMAVDGSSTPVKFCVRPTEAKNKFISSVTLTIHDAQMNFTGNEIRRFGTSAAAPGLTNGLALNVLQAGEEFNIFTSSIKTVSDFYRYADVGSVINIVNGVTASVDFLTLSLHFPFPLGLESGTDDEFSLVVSDDLTTMTLFEAEFTGFSQNTEEK